MVARRAGRAHLTIQRFSEGQRRPVLPHRRPRASAVAKPSVRKFPGFSFTGGKEPRRRIAPQALARFKAKVRELTRRTCGRSLAQIAKELSRYLIGWRGYSGFCQTPSVLRTLDEWLRRRCAPSPGNNGSAVTLALPSCDAAASAGIWRHKPPVARMALGGSQTAPRSPSPCQSRSSDHSAWLPSRACGAHNPPNRRIRTRMSGGVGGAEPRGTPLSRFWLDREPISPNSTSRTRPGAGSFRSARPRSSSARCSCR
jgi:Group II intron, maturase-specific domain